MAFASLESFRELRTSLLVAVTLPFSLALSTERSATDDYKEYLQKRKAIKEMIDNDCKELNIILL